MFDINDARPKCEDSLSGQLVCSVIVGSLLRRLFEDTGNLPSEPIAARVTCALALPIADFAKWHERYAAMLEGKPHTVHVHNFAEELSVRIEFDSVTVLPEGAAAQFAISKLGVPFLDAALEDARAHGMPCEGETGATLLSYKNTIGVDVGEGTVNFPVFRDGKVNVEASSSIDRGYGTVLADVCELARGTGYAPSSRKELSEFMLKKDPSPRDLRIRERLGRLIDDECDVFCRDVVSEYTRVLRRSRLVSDVVYVYGGGADAMRARLWPALVEASRVDDDIYTPVMYLSSEQTRVLNRDGLFTVAEAVNRRAKSKIKTS
jgi:plasmid segregation protein ParM